MKRWLSLSQLARTKQMHMSEAGYTITEVMIVLAVSTAMFVAIVAGFSGKQASVEFTQAVRDYEARLQGVIDDVTNGMYNSQRNCTITGSGPTISAAGPTVSSGSKEGCIFLGKLIVARTRLIDTVVTLVGRRVTAGPNPRNVENLLEATPRADSSINADIVHTFQLETRRIVRLSNAAITYGAFAFINNLGGSNVSNGSQVVLLHGRLGGSPLPTSVGTESNNPNLANLEFIAGGIMICLRGQNDARAEIRVSETGGIISELNTPNVAGGLCFNA
jgi:type II secretory pathway pseudopilin PulG